MIQITKDIDGKTAMVISDWLHCHRYQIIRITITIRIIVTITIRIGTFIHILFWITSICNLMSQIHVHQLIFPSVLALNGEMCGLEDVGSVHSEGKKTESQHDCARKQNYKMLEIRLSHHKFLP